MLLTVDIGNTNINFGIFKGKVLIKKFFIPTVEYQVLRFKRIMGSGSIDDSIICSVVPSATKRVVQDLRKLFGREPYIIGKDIKAPIRNLYRFRNQVGQDRLVNAYAGIMFYGAPLIVVDFGTAITFDVISKNKEYLGGMILPGLDISLEALAKKTALLPKIKLESPREFIGRETKSSILSGIVYGFAALADELSLRIKREIGKSAKVIGTGGNIDLIAKFSKCFNFTDINLTLKGLNLIYCLTSS